MSRSNFRLVLVYLCALTACLVSHQTVFAAFPPPSNDTSATAQIITSLPAIIEGSNVNGTSTIDATTITGLSSVPGPDVFYRFTPPSTGSYWIMMIPWRQIPVYGATGAMLPSPDLCVYVRRVSNGVFQGGADANPRFMPETVVLNLTGGVQYEIIVDSIYADPRLNQFEFTLIVSGAPVGSTEDCTNYGTIDGTMLPHVSVGTVTGAVDDVSFTEGTGRCDVANTAGLALAGRDHVYEFQTGPDPSDAGEYMINLIPTGTVWNGYVYVVDSCPPFYPLGCFGAASHTASTSNQAEAIVVSLDFDKKYYIIVDAATTTLTNARYALLVDRATGYNITEVEPNDTPGTASPLHATDQNGGQLVGPFDVDYFSFAAQAGSRLYAFVDLGTVLLSGLDTRLRVFGTNGTTLLEFDDDDGEPANSPVATLVQRTSAGASVIAGTPLFSTGTHYLQVAGDGSGTNTVARYSVHYGLQPAGRTPTPECEPNNTALAADMSGKEYYSGVIATQGDQDYYAFTATAGERVLVALDGDPERDSGGSQADHPAHLRGALTVYDPDGDLLISVTDPNAINAAQVPDYPAQALAFTAPISGTYKVRVTGAGATDFGPGRTYHLAIFRNNAAPSLAEARDPVIDSITPDFDADTLAVEARDNAPGDTGICALALSADSVNLQISASFSNGDPTVSFTVGLVTPGMSGYGKIIVTDCAGNTACAFVQIDADDPVCSGNVTVNPRRTFRSRHDPIHVPDNQPAGPGINGTIDIPESAIIQDLNVTVTIETIYPLDIDVFLESPMGTVFEVFTDRGGTSSGWDITNATFDDSASQLMPLLSSAAPYTGTWLPEGAGGLAVFNGQNAQGTWKLNVRDDSGSGSTAGGGARLVRWSLDINAGFAGPETYQGLATDTAGVNGGVATIEMIDADNVTLEVSPGFVVGDLSVPYTVRLLNPAQNGSCTIVVTDLSENSCETLVSLNGLPDSTPPSNTGFASREIEMSREVQGLLPNANPVGVVSTVNLGASNVVGEVEVEVMIDTLSVGRIASTLTHDGRYAVLLNRTGMTERGSVGLTKDNIEVYLDDDAPAADDAHLEPPLGTIEFLGLHQPDGRGEYVGDGITTDYRDNMLFALEGLDSAGAWDLYVADFRLQGAAGERSVFRRWRAVVKSPGAPERYVGQVRDEFPQAGICSIELGLGASNLTLEASFSPGDAEAEYVVSLTDPSESGTGSVEITDCVGNTTIVPISLAAGLDDQNLPIISGAVDPVGRKFEGVATDQQPGDSGIVSVELLPYSENLQFVSISPNPPNGAGMVEFTVGLTNTAANGRGYVRVTDATGYRRHALVHIDVVPPTCDGFVSRSKRYRSNDLPQEIPDNNPSGVVSSIVVPDLNIVSDVDITVNITHGFDDDIHVALTSPAFLTLWGDIGSTGNDFIHTTIDDEAPGPMPDVAAAAPFTGRWQPMGGPTLFNLDGVPAAGTYSLLVRDDKTFDTGSFDSWSITIESLNFPWRFQGETFDWEARGLGVGSIALLGDACNVALNTDPYTPGDSLVVFEVTLVNQMACGRGTVRVTDLGGNYCDQYVELNGFCGVGDLNHDGMTNLDDVGPFVAALLAGAGDCTADANSDGVVNGLDIQPFIVAILP